MVLTDPSEAASVDKPSRSGMTSNCRPGLGQTSGFSSGRRTRLERHRQTAPHARRLSNEAVPGGLRRRQRRTQLTVVEVMREAQGAEHEVEDRGADGLRDRRAEDGDLVAHVAWLCPRRNTGCSWVPHG